MENIKEILINIFFSEINIGNVSLPFNLFGLLIRLVIPSIVLFFIFKLIKKGIFALINRSKVKDESRNNARKWIRHAFNFIYYILVAVFISSLLGAETVKYFRKFFEVLNQPFIESGGTRITIITILLTIPVFYTGSWVGRTVKKMINRDLLERMGFDDSKKFSFLSINCDSTKDF